MRPANVKPGRIVVAALLATVAIFGGLVLAITLNLREQLRAEVLQREADAIYAVAQLHLEAPEARLAALDPAFALDDLFAAVLDSARLKGVLAVQLFDGNGTLRQAQPLAPEDAEASRWWPNPLPAAAARFFPAASLDMVSPRRALEHPRVRHVPLLEIAVPLRKNPEDVGASPVARYWVNGDGVAREFRRMDRGLALQAGGAFVGGAALIGLVLAWAFSRLAEANRRLVEQSADLVRANQELDFAAKTGALGAISAHLIHGLKNPLAGIEGFVTETATGGADAGRGEACRTAVETTRRLRLLVNEVVSVLRDEAEGEGGHGVPAAEVVEAARRRAAPLAEQAGVILTAHAGRDIEISGRSANLAGLVLANLLANAIEALPRRGQLSLEARRGDTGAEFIVADDGPGLPAAAKEGLFRPVPSAKRGGGGMGLAISHRLAKHAGGDLQLVRSDAQGTTFCLLVPLITAPVKAV